MKQCSRCNLAQPASNYYSHPTNKDGLQYLCKTCCAAVKRKGAKTKAELRAEVYPTEGMKVCAACGLTLPYERFSRKGGDRGDALKPRCKACCAKQFEEWSRRKGLRSREALRSESALRWAPTLFTRICSVCGKEKPLEAMSPLPRRYCLECRGPKESASYAKNKPARREKAAAYRAANLEKARHWARSGEHRRRLRVASVDDVVSDADWSAILERYGHRCLCCGAGGKMTMDHVVPVSRGGRHHPSNIQPLCQPCNSSKGRKTIDFRPPAEQQMCIDQAAREIPL